MKPIGAHKRCCQRCIQSVVPIVLIGTMMCWTARAQVPAANGPEPGGLVRQSNLQRINELDVRFKTLRRRIDDLDEEYRQASAEAKAIDTRLGAAGVGDREGLRSQKVALYNRTANAIAEREQAYDALELVDTRLKNLRRLDLLDMEIARMRAEEKEKSTVLHQLELDWTSKRSQMTKSLMLSKVAQQELELLLNPGNAIGAVILERARKRGSNTNELLRASDKHIKRVSALANNLKREADATWAEGRKLLDLADSVRIEIVDIQVSIELAIMTKRAIEGRAREWDHD